MARPILPKGLRPDTAASQAAAKLLRAKVEEVLLYLEPAATGAVEGVHSLRVAVKRLRETLRLFQRLLPTPERKEIMPLVEEVNDTLGRVRDRDVLSGHAREMLEATPGAAPALEAALAAWEQERGPELAAALETWERVTRRERLIPRLRRLARATAGGKGRLAKLPLERFAYLAIEARLERARQRLPEAQASPDPAALHSLRIVVKRLKYTVEPFLGAMPSLDGPYQTVAEIQEALGLAHDFDVLEAALTDFFHAHGRRIKGTAEALRALEERRATLYAAAHAVIGALAEEEWGRGLLDALD